MHTTVSSSATLLATRAVTRLGAGLAVVAGSLWCAAEEPRGRALPVHRPAETVSPLLDDAGLNDVQLLGKKHGWAVGDRAAVWHSEDGGAGWNLVPVPARCALRSVCFLTNRVGWIVGGAVRRQGSDTYGVVLHTTDGGETWESIGGPNLPLLHDVQFFDLDEGVAIGESNSPFPTGVLMTSDGGKTWTPVTGKAGDGWRCTAFLDPTSGFVAGRLGRYAPVSAGEVQPAPAGASGLRGISDVSIGADHRGWLAGDGGLVLRTETGGVAWRQPDGDFPRELRDVMDFRAVATAGESVWLAGQPGSVIWHSENEGQTWSAQETGNPLPLQAITFSSPTHGCAVGALGRILRTTDGGQTWETVRGEGRRAALLAVHAHESHVSLNVPTKYGHELGYRTVATVVARRDIGPDGDDGRTLDLRLQQAMTAAGGADATVDWAFPIAAPGLDRNQKELVHEWELLTDNRLREKMLGRLVAQLCVWRPDVVIIDKPAQGDAATTPLADAVRLAVRHAADASQHAALRENLRLPVWEVKRLFHRQPAESGGSVRLEAYEFLPRLGASLTMAAAEPYRLLRGENITLGQNEAFVPVSVTGAAPDGAVGPRGLFTGLGLTPGSAARRALLPIDDENFDRMQNLAQQQRNFAAYAARMLDDPRHAAQLVGQTKDIIAGAPPAQAAVQLLNLAREYRIRGEWDHAQAVLVELAEHYPQEPPAAEAMSWLLSFWVSEEVGWQRLRSSSSIKASRKSTDRGIVQADLQRTIQQARAEIFNDDEPAEAASAPSPIQQASVGGQLRVGGTQDQHVAKQESWLSNAERLVKSLRRIAPSEAFAPDRQFLIAALYRKQSHPGKADEIYRNFLSETADGPWNRIAAGELWLTQPSTIAARPTAVCRRAATPPVLDGVLDDACWERAAAVILRNEAEHRQMTGPFVDGPVGADRPSVQWAYDEGFVYIAARVPRETSLPADRPQLPGRTHDADLSRHDRLSFAIDTDRDYATFYEIEVDQRGWSADACWENRAWNCRRFIAAKGDNREWRIEMAIPFPELVPSAPEPGATWAVGISRVMPTIGVESWTHPAGSRPRPEGFGLLRFE